MRELTPETAFARSLAQHLPGIDDRAPRLGLAVSGGGDSTALALVAARWGRGELRAVTVDHGLRPGSAAEAAAVGLLARRLGMPHDILRWTGWDGQGNLQDHARRARQQLIADWARAHRLDAVLIAHTADDQAETFLLRLARGSGVDGLASMSAARCQAGVLWLRPLLTVRRQVLRDLLTAEGETWAEDPSNSDPRFDRVRMRQALPMLADLGLTVERLAGTAAQLAQAREALGRQAEEAARRLLRVEAGDVLVDLRGLAAETWEIRGRLLSRALCWVASAEYRPRQQALHRLSAALDAGRGGTLHGCLVTERHGVARIGREPSAVAGLVSPAPGVWDGRWRISGPDRSGLQVRALGEAGLLLRPRWRERGLPRRTLLGSPAIWEGEALVAAPLLDAGEIWRAEPEGGDEAFFSGFIAH